MDESTTTTSPVPSGRLADVEAFLDVCEAELLHPAEVAHRLVRQGWPDVAAHQVGERYRRRFDEHPLGYSAFLFTVGFTGLSLGSSAHLLLDELDGRSADPDTLALWLTVLVIAAPLSAWSWRWIARVDDDDPVAVWSRPRRTLARTLLWACGLVGGFRLLHYVFTLIATITGSSWASDRSLLVGLANVAVTTAITFPLGYWAFRFLHRFDDEDPSIPRRRSKQQHVSSARSERRGAASPRGV
jgi:hypothetical protein